MWWQISWCRQFQIEIAEVSGVLDGVFLVEEVPEAETLFFGTCSHWCCLDGGQLHGTTQEVITFGGDTHLGASSRGSHATCVVCFNLCSAPSYIFSSRALSNLSAKPSREGAVSDGLVI